MPNYGPWKRGTRREDWAEDSYLQFGGGEDTPNPMNRMVDLSLQKDWAFTEKDWYRLVETTTQKDRLETEPPTTSLAQTLCDRGRRYGDFVDNAAIAQHLKSVIEGGDGAPETIWYTLNDDQREALHMFCSKISRIVCGDPNYPDNWRDIAGFATLVADRLEGSSD